MRFSLRAFFLLFTIVAVWLGWWLASANRQKEARRALAALRAEAVLEGEDTYRNETPSYRAQLSRRLVDYIDIDYLLPVTVVRTPYLGVRCAEYTSTEVIRHLRSFPHLRHASLTHTEIDNDDLYHLQGLGSLRELDLEMTRLHEGDLDGLRGLRLRWLSLSRTRVDDEGVKSLAQITSLEHLDLTRTKVSDVGLSQLESLHNLKTLIIRRSLVTPHGYRAFQDRRPDINVRWGR